MCVTQMQMHAQMQALLTKKNASQGTMHACMIEAVCQGGAEVVLSLC